MVIRNATLDDINHIKQIADKNKTELGFVLRPALMEAVQRGELLYNPLGAFCHWHRRRDGVSVIYEICVLKKLRGQGFGKEMIQSLPLPIRLKCLVDNVANDFYQYLGFELVATEPGKKRALNIWQLSQR